jgi:2-polyprenyl-6-methoxyphenol hydroxylase-like FAD-dependent oxidoreductase
VDARAGLALEQCLPPGSLAVFQATCSEASTRLTVVSERLRVLNEQRRTTDTDPYAPATLSTSVNRHTLREVLAAGLDGRLVFGCELTGYELAGSQPAGSQPAGQGDGRGGVRLHVADGRQAEADLLVGADGVGSAVRRQYLPAAAPADTGKRCVYGTIPLGPGEADRLPPALRDGFTAVIGGQVGLATGVVRFRQRPEQAAPWLSPAGDYLMWAVAGDARRFGVADERLTAMSPAELHALTFLVRIRTSPPVPPWPPSRVTVLGDAIHAMSPARGSGANTALQDAALLCRMLTGAAGNGAAGNGARTDLAGSGTARAGSGAARNGGDLIAAVGEYERQMRDYGYAAVAASQAAEAETGARHNRLMFWLYRRMTGARA